MIKQTDKNIAGENAELNKHETSGVLTYSSKLIPVRNQKSKDSQTEDLIVSLSDAYENKRARQVFEWEKIRRQNIYRAL